MAVVEKAIEDRSRHHGVAEHATPLPDRAVGGDQHRAALIAPRHELEEEVRGVRLEGQIAELVDDQEFGFGEVGQLFSSLPSACALASWATSVGAATNSTV